MDTSIGNAVQQQMRDSVGLYTLPPTLGTRRIVIATPVDGDIVIHAHNAVPSESGALVITTQVGQDGFISEIFPAGTWRRVQLEVPSAASIEAYREKVVTFTREQSELHQRVASLGNKGGANTLPGTSRGLLNLNRVQ